MNVMIYGKFYDDIKLLEKDIKTRETRLKDISIPHETWILHPDLSKTITGKKLIFTGRYINLNIICLETQRPDIRKNCYRICIDDKDIYPKSDIEGVYKIEVVHTPSSDDFELMLNKIAIH